MDSQLLRIAIQVVRAGSFAAAARDAGVDPSSISRQVAALEDELGLRLFERSTRRLALTEAGRLYLRRALPALEALDEAADAARDAITRPAGLLRVTTSVAFGERWLMPRVPGFRAGYPDVELELILTDEMVDLAGDGIELAIRLGPRPDRGDLVTAKLFDTPYRVVASPGYLARAGRPESPADLAGHDGLLFRLPAFQSAWRFRTTPGGPETEGLPRRSLTISNALALRRAALSDMGVALLADWTIGADLASGALVDLFPEYEASAGRFDSAAWVAYLSRSYVPARMRAFIDHLNRSETRL